MSPVTLEQLGAWMQADKEDEHLEFKEAKSQFDSQELAKYCCALANERGGRLLLGVTNQRPRRVVGSQACRDVDGIRAQLHQHLGIRVDVDVLAHPDGRVVVFTVPARPLGEPMGYRGSYWMRLGESLMPMTNDMLRRIFDETVPDFSARICEPAKLDDLSSEATDIFRNMWRSRSGNDRLATQTDAQLLADCGLIADGGVTYAALMLLGTSRSLDRHLSQCEVVFEYRSTEAPGPAQQRVEFRRGFFLFVDEIWHLVNLRNDLQHYQSGLFMYDIPTFNEVVVREAILNAVSHRDYRLQGSIFVRQYPRRLEVVSPGGFPPGITVDNILSRQAARNRLVAETFGRCGLVERAGQGMDRMFEQCIKESKPRPDFTDTDDYQVSITLQGEVQDSQFVRFLEQVDREKQFGFTLEDYLVLDLVLREKPISELLQPGVPGLIEVGILERVGKGRGSRLILSRRFYEFAGKRGVHTRRRGLDREANKAILLKHIQSCQQDGCELKELRQVLPALTNNQLQTLLRALKAEGAICCVGRTRAARWFPASSRTN